MKTLRQRTTPFQHETKYVPLWPGRDVPHNEQETTGSFSKLAFHVQTGVEFIDPLTVTHLEAESNYTSIYCTSGRRVVLSRTLKSCMAIFPQNFLRIHQSYLVNPQHIQTYLRQESGLRLDSGVHLPISRSGKAVMQEFVRKGC